MSEQRQLSAEERRANVQRMHDMEGRLGELENLGMNVCLEAARLTRRVHDMRDDLREIFGLQPLGTLPPMVVAPAEREEQNGD